MKTAIIIGAIVLIYGTFSTVFHDKTLVGDIGRSIGEGNLKLFGYLAYVDMLLLLFPLYRFFRDPATVKRIDIYAGWLLFFVSAILLQVLIAGTQNCGAVGSEMYRALLPFIGQAGMWLLWLMIFLLSLMLLVEDPASIYRYLSEKREKKQRSDTYENPFSYEEPRSVSGKTEDLAKKPFFFLHFVQKIKNIFKNPFYHGEPLWEEDDILKLDLKPVEPGGSRRYDPEGTEREDALFDYKSTLENTDEIEESILESEYAGGGNRIAEKNGIIGKTEKTPPAKQSSISSSGVEIVDELEENSKILAQIDKGKVEKPRNFRLPRLDFLQKPPKTSRKINESEIDRKIGELLDKLGRFKIEGDVIRTYTGPLVTTFEFKPAPNVKVSKILGLQDDLAMALSAETIRIQAPIPGRNVVGIEIPNENFETIYLREILESDIFKSSKSPLTVAMGKDIVGKPFVTDLKKLPHLLIAGTTGSGKSVGINAMLLSLLYRNDPDHLKLILIDPKMLEFSIYNDIPHLLTPVIIEPKKAIYALANMVHEMERRYKEMSENRVKNIENYNEKMKKEGRDTMPYIVIVIDELADLMMNGGKEVEYSIARLAQMARAAGIHLIVATQRPSVDVVTGLIKANLPSRLSYRVGQRIDSKVILDQMGAESLLGRGDALFTPPGVTGLVRLHAPWNSEEEIEEVVEFLKSQREPQYDERYLKDSSPSPDTDGADGEMDLDPLYEKAKDIVLNDKKTSISYLQRKLQIGYNRSANLIEQLEKTGILSEPNAKGNREIIV